MSIEKQTGKPISLWPLKLDDVLGDVMQIKPEPKAKKQKSKARQRRATKRKVTKNERPHDMEIPNGTTQELAEELFREIPALAGYRFIDESRDLEDFHRRTITLRNNRNEEVTVEVYLDAPFRDGHKESIRRALIET